MPSLATWKPSGKLRTPDKEDSMKIWQIALCLMFFALSANAAVSKRIYRNSHGRIIGSVTRRGNYSIYYDAFGRKKGSATTYGKKTIYRNSQGQKVGTRIVIGRTAIYCDTHGLVKRTSYTYGRKTIYHDKWGCTIGSATRNRGGVTYRSARGRICGTKR